MWLRTFDSQYQDVGKSVQQTSDGVIDIADAMCVLTYLFGGDGNGPCKQKVSECLNAADANDDGAVDLADTIRVLSHLLAGSGDLPEPFGECGTDGAEDPLGCDAFAPCGT